MRIAIISDIHDNLVNLAKCLDWCQTAKVATIICCGDIANSKTLKFLASKFSGTIHLVGGNADIYDKDEINQYENIRYYDKIGRIEIDGRHIGICHEPHLIPEVIAKERRDIIFFGHTHKPWIAKRQKIVTVNPGTLDDMPHSATFAVWGTTSNRLELKILDNL